MRFLTKRNLFRATANALASRRPVKSFTRSLGWSMLWKTMRALFGGSK